MGGVLGTDTETLAGADPVTFWKVGVSVSVPKTHNRGNLTPSDRGGADATFQKHAAHGGGAGAVVALYLLMKCEAVDLGVGDFQREKLP